MCVCVCACVFVLVYSHVLMQSQLHAFSDFLLLQKFPLLKEQVSKLTGIFLYVVINHICRCICNNFTTQIEGIHSIAYLILHSLHKDYHNLAIELNIYIYIYIYIKLTVLHLKTKHS